MKTSFCLLGFLCALGVGFAPAASLAGPAAAPHITLKFEGGLREAVHELAARGHLNLVVLGDVNNEHAEVFFEDVTPEEALSTLAKIYHLKLEHEGKVWTLRADPALAHAGHGALPAPPAPPAAPAAPAAPGIPGATFPMLAPVPQASDEDDSGAASDARDAAEDAKEAARNAAREANEARREAANKMRNKFEKLRNHHGDHDFTGTGIMAIPEGETYENAVVYGGSLTINGHVSKDAVCFGCSVHLGPKAEVEGDVVAFGGSITQDEGAEVGGDRVEMGGAGIWRLVGQGVKKGIVHVGHEDDSSDSHEESSSSHASLPTFILKFALYFGLGFLALMFFPSRMKQIEAELVRDPLKCGLAGLVGGFALIPLTVLLCITIIGIPFAVVLWILVLLAMAMGFAAVATEIGTRLPILKGNRKTQAAVLALGILVLLVLQLLSFVGYFVLAVVGCLAFGAIIRTRLGSTPKGFPEPV